jgi:antitoxin CptB
VTTKSLDAESELMLKRLKWRSRRSMLEVDLYLDRFIFSQGLERLTNHELEAYSQLLELNDWDFLALLQGIKECRDVVMQNVINKISNINV